MADTIANVPLPRGQWVDLYVASGISVGTQITVQQISGQQVRLHTGADTPTPSDGYRILERGAILENASGDSGAWAISIADDGLVNVGEKV